MVRMKGERNIGFQEQRRQRLEWLGNYLQQVVQTEGIEYGKVRTILMSKWGLSSEKTIEYMDIVIESQGFLLEDGRIIKSRKD